MKIGTTDIDKCYVGNTEIEKLYLGSNLVYQKDVPYVEKWYDGFSGNSNANGIKLAQPFSTGNGTWQVEMKFETGSDMTTERRALFHTAVGNNREGRYGPNVTILDGYFALVIPYTSSGWDIYPSGSHYLLKRTIYWIRFGWTGEAYYLDYSLDGRNYTRDINVASTTPAYSPMANTYIGVYAYDYSYNDIIWPFDGCIDMSSLKITKNNVVIFDGNRATVGTDYILIGAPTQTFSIWYYGFRANSSFITIAKAVPSTITSYEIMFRIKDTGVSNLGRVLGNLYNNKYSPQLESPEDSGRQYWIGHPSSSHSWDATNTVTPIPSYIPYCIKLMWSNNNLSVYLSADMQNWTLDQSISTNGCGWTEGVQIGADNDREWFSGYIDMYNSYIKINNEYWLNGKTAVEGIDFTIEGNL